LILNDGEEEIRQDDESINLSEYLQKAYDKFDPQFRDKGDDEGKMTPLNFDEDIIFDNEHI
jgi:hypothetical protein